MKSNRPLVIFVVGPTATGKSAFSIEAALQTNGEILNTDSVQVYASVDIGTAKPSPAEMAKVPHHLFSYVPEGETSTAGDFRREALAKIDERFRSGVHTIFAVGGSGFYVQALEKGMYPAPEVPNEIRLEIERDIESRGLPPVFEELKTRDPEYAATISQNDGYRIRRALEIVRFLQGAVPTTPPSEDKTWSGLRKKFEAEIERQRPFDVLKIGIQRPRPRIRVSAERRAHEMIARGLIDEVRDLRERGLSRWAPLLSVGYKETQEYLEGRLPRTELESAIVTSTMQLVKRQTTWFRRDPDISWFDAENGWAAPLAFLEREFDKRRKS